MQMVPVGMSEIFLGGGQGGYLFVIMCRIIDHISVQ